MHKKYSKDIYDKLPKEKKENILNAAIKEFAAAGIDGCNVRDIAKAFHMDHYFIIFPQRMI
jgi:AcrR family transcriptional regulator